MKETRKGEGRDKVPSGALCGSGGGGSGTLTLAGPETFSGVFYQNGGQTWS